MRHNKAKNYFYVNEKETRFTWSEHIFKSWRVSLIILHHEIPRKLIAYSSSQIESEVSSLAQFK